MSAFDAALKDVNEGVFQCDDTVGDRGTTELSGDEGTTLGAPSPKRRKGDDNDANTTATLPSESESGTANTTSSDLACNCESKWIDDLDYDTEQYKVGKYSYALKPIFSAKN